jgi:hypothetical protein
VYREGRQLIVAQRKHGLDAEGIGQTAGEWLELAEELVSGEHIIRAFHGRGQPGAPECYNGSLGVESMYAVMMSDDSRGASASGSSNGDDESPLGM